MKITNQFNLPQTLVDAVSFDAHRTHGDISVTTLIDSPRIFYLKKKHHQDVTQDVSGMIWALFGTAVHSVLERANIKTARRNAFMEVVNTLKEYSARSQNNQLNDEETEEEADQANRVLKWLLRFMFKWFPELEDRYMFEVSLQYECNGWVLSGTLDLYDKIEKCLYDYKVCSVWMYIYPDMRKKWKQQLNCYALFLKEKGIPVEDIKVVAIFRDWNRRKAMSEADYPKRNCLTIQVGLYPEETMKQWIEHRIKLHQKALEGGPPLCTGEERWATAKMYAVLQKGGKRALANSKTESEEVAKKFIRDNQRKYDKELYVRETSSLNRRCEEYCMVSEFCDQWKSIQQEGVVNNDDF